MNGAIANITCVPTSQRLLSTLKGSESKDCLLPLMDWNGADDFTSSLYVFGGTLGWTELGCPGTFLTGGEVFRCLGLVALPLAVVVEAEVEVQVLVGHVAAVGGELAAKTASLPPSCCASSMLIRIGA